MIAYIISLKRCHERRMLIGQMAGRIGLSDYIMVDAVDGNTFTGHDDSVDVEAFRKNTGRDPVVGEVGCYQSHLRAYEMIAGMPDDHALILEDDVISILDEWSLIQDVLRKAIPVDHLHVGEPGDSMGVVSKAQCRYKQRMDRQWLGTYSYLVSRRFCAHMLSEHSVMNLPIDNVICNLSKNPGGFIFASLREPLFRHNWRMQSHIKRPPVEL